MWLVFTTSLKYTASWHVIVFHHFTQIYNLLACDFEWQCGILGVLFVQTCVHIFDTGTVFHQYVPLYEWWDYVDMETSCHSIDMVTASFASLKKWSKNTVKPPKIRPFIHEDHKFLFILQFTLTCYSLLLVLGGFRVCFFSVSSCFLLLFFFSCH